MLCLCHKKCAKLHKQSQFTSKFILTSVRNICVASLPVHILQPLKSIPYLRPEKGTSFGRSLPTTFVLIMNSPVMQCQFIMALK